MEEHAIPVGHLVFPVLLPFAQRVFLQEAMSPYDKHRGSSLEAHASPDAYDGVTHVHVTPNGIGSTYLLHFLDGFDGVIILHIVHSLQLTLLECQAKLLRPRLSGMLQVSTLWQSLCRVQYLTTTDRGAPDSHVIRILQLGKVGWEPILVQIVYLLLTAQSHVTRQGDDLLTRSHHKESHIEAHLVVSSSSRSMSDGICSYLVGIACYGQCLEDALRAHRDRVGAITQHVTIDHVFQTLLVVFTRHVERHIFHCPQLVGILFILLQLFLTETTSVCTGSIYLVALLLSQIHHRKRGIQAPTKSYHNFLLSHFILSFYYFFKIHKSAS